jgi:D-alanyl-D-alanine carboxypeptidase (penicillin-binding protein 5/6)
MNINQFKQIGLMTLLWLLTACPVLGAGAEFEVKAKAAILLEPQNGQILFAQNEHRRLPPASVTKVMTMLLVMEAVDRGKLKWTDMIPASTRASQMGGSQVYLREHEELTLEEMFKAIAVVSANDASTAVAEYLYGTVQDFIIMMNRRARRLGLKNTHFANETGLTDPNHYSSAHDLAMISRELLKHPDVLKFTSIWMDSLRDGKFVLKNTNNLIKYYSGADGLKTGHTDAAKYCLAATARRNKLRLLSVILGAKSDSERVAQTRRLLDYGFRNYEWSLIKPAKAAVGIMKLKNANLKTVGLQTHDKLEALRERDNQKPVRTRVRLFRNVKLPIGVDQPVGVLKAYQDDKLLASAPVYPVQPVKKAHWLVLGWRALWELIQKWLGKKFGE